MEIMKGVWVLLSFLALTSAANIKVCHRNHTSNDKRISYGSDADITEAKFYAYFQCGDMFCGATLVTMNRLITAAHCVIKCNPTDANIIMGMNSKSEIDEGKGDRYGISEIHMYPGYEQNQDFNIDIAILFVNGEVRATDKVDRIPYDLNKPPLDDYLTCFGYGRTQTGQNAEKLQKSQFLTKSYDRNMIITDAEKTSVLPGDSGGPCIYNGHLVADIVSYGDNWNGAVMTGSPDILNFLRSHGL